MWACNWRMQNAEGTYISSSGADTVASLERDEMER